MKTLQTRPGAPVPEAWRQALSRLCAEIGVHCEAAAALIRENKTGAELTEELGHIRDLTESRRRTLEFVEALNRGD